MRTWITIVLVSFAFSACIPIPYELVPSGDRLIGDAYSVNSPVDWTKLKQSEFEIWTVDGFSLQSLLRFDQRWTKLGACRSIRAEKKRFRVTVKAWKRSMWRISSKRHWKFLAPRRWLYPTFDQRLSGVATAFVSRSNSSKKALSIWLRHSVPSTTRDGWTSLSMPAPCNIISSLDATRSTKFLPRSAWARISRVPRWQRAPGLRIRGDRCRRGGRCPRGWSRAARCRSTSEWSGARWRDRPTSRRRD